MARRTPKSDVAVAEGPDPRLGLTLGALRIDSVLGRGGMGVVYKATDTSLGREVAVKFLTAESMRARERFVREARLAAALSHPNIVVVHHVGEHENCPYIVTELMTGGSLETLVVKGGPQPPAAALKLMIPCARALQHAHERQIIHRDIKPANLLLTADNIVKVADFGLAKSLTDAAVLTRPGMMVGSPHFIAPDMCLGFQPSPATDIYSLGCTLFFVLTGKAPFDSPQVPKIIFMHMQDPFPDLPPSVPSPPNLIDVIRKAAAKKPTDRFASAGEMADAMEAILVTLSASNSGKSVIAPPPADAASAAGAQSAEERALVTKLLEKYRGMTQEQKKNLPSVLSMAVKIVPSDSDVLAGPSDETGDDLVPVKKGAPAKTAPTAKVEPTNAKPAAKPTAVVVPTAPAKTAPAADPTVPMKPAGRPAAVPAPDPRLAAAKAHYERGKAAAEAGDFKTAVTEFDAVLAVLPDDPAALNYRGLARYKLKQLDGSVADFTRALEIDPKFVRAYNNRGLAFNKLGKYDKAVADFTEAIKRSIAPESAVFYNRGLAYYNRNELDKAVADFDQTLKLNPKYGSAFNNRGLAHYKRGHYDAAVADFDKAVALKPDDARAFYNRGLAHAAAGRKAKADADFGHAVKLDPGLKAQLG